MRDALIFHLTYFTYLWKFDEVLAKTILHSFLDTVYNDIGGSGDGASGRCRRFRHGGRGLG